MLTGDGAEVQCWARFHRKAGAWLQCVSVEIPVSFVRMSEENGYKYMYCQILYSSPAKLTKTISLVI